MAEAILFDMSKSILSQLSSVAVQEIGVWWNAEDELNKLEETITTIQAVLLDAEEEHQLSNQFKHWLGRLRDVLYDADELLDDFSTGALRRQVMKENVMLPKEVRLFFSRSNQFVFGLKLGHKVKGIREKLDAIANDRQKFHFAVRRTKAPFFSKGRDHVISLGQREIASLQSEEDVFGRDSDKEKIIKLLKSDAKDRVSVLPIVGTGGLGKTTLAKLVHNDEDVKSHFDVRMWVYVGDVDLSAVEVAKKATKSAVDRQSKLLSLGEENDEVKKFKEAVGGKKILLVLDDVWSEDLGMWRNLENLWRNGTLESKIIVTTRSLKVAEMTRNLEPYKLGDLTPDDSWNFFVKIVFMGKEPENEEVKKNGKTIVEKCAGVPLAIKTIGNLLYFLNPTDWLPFVTSELSKYPQANNDIFPTLKLSYDHLPSPLKYCFTYCKLFPKGHVIYVKTLVQFWIAQGYIKPSDLGESLEDIGFQYCKVLVSRSFLEQEEVDELGNLIFCRMHDIMHDLASFLGGDEIVSGSNSLDKNIKKNTRHVSINLDDFSKPFESSKFLKSLLRARKLRTFLSSMSMKLVFNEIQVDQCDKICKKLQSLLVLDLSHNQMTKIPNSIGNLKHLRHLDFSLSEKIKILPNSITRLINLQVLDLSYCWSLEELPKDINKLVNLKHLHCVACNSLKYMPRGLGQLSLLQTLQLFVVRAQEQPTVTSRYTGGLEELKKLNSLTGSLEIRNVKCISEYEAANMVEKRLLQSLSVVWDNHSVDDEMSLLSFPLPPKLKELSMEGYNCERFPGWPSSVSHLVEIDLIGWRRCKQLPPLDQIPSLRFLSIRDFDDLEYIEIGSGPTFFPSLMRLELNKCEKMKGWRKTSPTTTTSELPQFSCLSNLKIYDCSYLNLETFPIPSKLEKLSVGGNEVATTFPNWLSSLTNLVEIELSQFKRCKHLSPLDQIPYLRILSIREFDDLEYIEIESGPTFFPSLERLEFNKCEKMKGWCKTSPTTTTTELPQFSCLSNLEIYDCSYLNLDTLPIPSKIEKLIVSGNEVATTFPNWLSSLTNLAEIHLINFKRCKHLPPLDQIPTLQVISIQYFDNLEYIEMFGSGPTFFPSLKTLDLKVCEKLEGWRKKGEHHDDTSTTTSTADLPQFHSLSQLTIENCYQLISECFPPTPKLNNMFVTFYERLSFPRCWRPSLLTNIVVIRLYSWGRCKYLPPLDQISSLQQLVISMFDNLEYIEFGSGSTFFPSLKTLQISACRNLKGWLKEGDELDTATAEQLPQFPCLSELIIRYCPNLISMPLFPTLDVELELRTVKKEILVRPLSNLKQLLIAEIKDFESLPPEWLRNLTSLQSLTIEYWPSLTHLPQEMQCLTSLQRLSITRCPQLEERCGNNKGVDWRNIAHIPNIQIDKRDIQGQYQLDNHSE